MASRGAHLSANSTVTAHGAEVVTPNDTTEIPVTRALYVGVGGNLAVTMADGQVVTFIGVPTGVVIPIQVSKVMATNTAATSLLALY
jgi:hypothetical protein